MTAKEPSTYSNTEDRAGPYRDFAAYSDLELERRRSSDQDFDAELFHDAVELVLGKIAGLAGVDQGEANDDHQ